MKKPYDYLIVGSGLFGASFARLATDKSKRCLVIDKRPHLGGNVHCEEIYGIQVHKYGPHIFHTSNNEVWEFVNRFVQFNRFTLTPKANYKGDIYSLPFNMNTFYEMWHTVRPKEARSKIETQRYKGEIHNLEEQALSLVGHDIYEKLIRGYTEKQWGRPCVELPPFIIRRLPVRFTYDNNYFNDRYQGIPEGGYNRLIEGILEGIECKTSCNYFDEKSYFDSLADQVVYSGPIDEYFGYRLGHLEYRSLRFKTETLHVSNYQGNAIVNYTDVSIPFTRIVEHKHFDVYNKEVQEKPVTVITREYPQVWAAGREAYYPINDEKNNRLYQQYKALAEQETNVIFGGRLAEYRYYDMDCVVESALERWKNQSHN